MSLSENHTFVVLSHCQMQDACHSSMNFSLQHPPGPIQRLLTSCKPRIWDSETVSKLLEAIQLARLGLLPKLFGLQGLYINHYINDHPNVSHWGSCSQTPGENGNLTKIHEPLPREENGLPNCSYLSKFQYFAFVPCTFLYIHELFPNPNSSALEVLIPFRKIRICSHCSGLWNWV